ncbi:hypothetical protein Tco_0445828 [Tanacetum coccineum]
MQRKYCIMEMLSGGRIQTTSRQDAALVNSHENALNLKTSSCWFLAGEQVHQFDDDMDDMALKRTKWTMSLKLINAMTFDSDV